jgi:hypothetical protein
MPELEKKKCFECNKELLGQTDNSDGEFYCFDCWYDEDETGDWDDGDLDAGQVQTILKDTAVKLFTYLERGEWNKPGRITVTDSEGRTRQDTAIMAVYTDIDVLKKLIDTVTSNSTWLRSVGHGVDNHRIDYEAYSRAKSDGEGGGAWKGDWTEPTRDTDYIKNAITDVSFGHGTGKERLPAHKINTLTPVSFFLKLILDSGPYDRPLGTVKMLLEAGSIPNKDVIGEWRRARTWAYCPDMDGYNDEFGKEIVAYYECPDPGCPTSTTAAINKMLDKYGKAAKKIQTKVRSRMKKKRAKKSKAAKTIQSKTRGHQTRRKQYIDRFKKYKAWKGTEAYDTILWGDEDMFNHLRESDRNFVIKMPGHDNYEAWNLDDYFKLTKIDKQGVHELNKFYECRAASGSMAPDNIIRDVSYIKLGGNNFVVKVPEWLSGAYLPDPMRRPERNARQKKRRKSINIPEPRVFELVKDKMVNALVSTAILDHEGNTMGGDHCAEGSKPEQIYTLKLLDEGTMVADWIDELAEYGAKKKKKKKKKALTKKKKATK